MRISPGPAQLVAENALRDPYTQHVIVARRHQAAILPADAPEVLNRVHVAVRMRIAEEQAQPLLVALDRAAPAQPALRAARRAASSSPSTAGFSRKIIWSRLV